MRAAHVPSVSFFVRGPHDASGFHPFPSMNDVIAANRSGYGVGNRLKRRLTELVATRCREVMAETGWVAPLGPVEVSFTWHEVWRGRDVDNVMSAQKFVLDGMVEAGMLRGDSQRYVPRPPAHGIVIDREHPGVTVEVSRIEEENGGD